MRRVSPLDDPTHTVVPVPPATSGVAWLRANVARFAEGSDHARRRRLAEDALGRVDPAVLRRPGHPVATLAAALGLPRERSLVDDVVTVAAAYQPHAPQTALADAALERLVARAGGRRDEPTAALIGLLVQCCDATRAMIAGAAVPVPATRRIAPDGTEVHVDLTDTPFGAGRHACPGEDHARALVEGVTEFARLHRGPEPLVLPNAWDVASAHALVEAGFAAIGTTSLGVAAANGVPDATGQALAPTLALARNLAELPVPVTVDIEAGFGADPADLAAELSVAGIAGVNIEDGRGSDLADPDEQAELVAGLKRGAPELFVNARVDTYWLGCRQAETRARAERYVAAGADGVFVPGLTEPDAIAALAAALPVPLNVLAQLPVGRLGELGVRRVSTGSLLFRVALDAAVAAATSVRDGGVVAARLGYGEVQRWSTEPLP